MNYRIEVTDNALAEAGEIYFWIHEDSPEVAWRWYDGLMAAFKSLSFSPQRCARAPESDKFQEELRQLLYGKYRILFSVQSNTVRILHVRHSARKPLQPDDDEAEQGDDEETE